MNSDTADMKYLDPYVQELLESRNNLLREFASIEDVHTSRDGRWTPRQILHHLFLTEQSVAKIFRSAERVCKACERYDDEHLQSERESTSYFLSRRDHKVEAPERIQPLDLSDEVDVVSELQASRHLLLSQDIIKNDEKMRQLQFTHAVRGDLSLYGWLWFVACHERRHTAQLMEDYSSSMLK